MQERHSLLSAGKPSDDRTTRGDSTSSLLNTLSPLLLVVITGGGVAMIHWLSDMGPGFAVMYLGILAVMLIAGIWRVAQWRSANPSGPDDVCEDAEATSTVALSDEHDTAALPVAPPSQRHRLIVRILGSYFLAVPMLLGLAAIFTLPSWMQSTWFQLLAAIAFLAWIVVILTFLALIFDAGKSEQMETPRTKAGRQLLSEIWRLILRSHN